MTSQLNDSDDENCDDPIKLFPNGFDSSFFFGSQQQITASADTKWKPTNNLTYGSYNEFSQRHSESNSECTITPMFIKLVDCVQFPWYFRKYTAQILQKTDPNQFETETEHDIIDVEDCDSNSSDCFIVEDLHPDFMRIKDHKETQKKSKIDTELQMALGQKQLAEIDLKRNIGLIGMKIAQKKYTKIKQNISTARKVSTKDVTAKTDKEEIRSRCQLGNSGETSSPLDIPVHFRINKIPENDNNNLETKDHSNNDNKNVDEHLMISSAHKLSKNVSTSIASKKPLNKSTSHVKNMKKCNKYKNEQLKSKNKAKSILIKMLASNQTTPKTCEVPELEQNYLEQSDNRENDQSDNNAEEPKSPILKCTTPKKPKSVPKPEFSKNVPTPSASKPELPPTIKNSVNAHKNLDKIVKKLKILNKIPNSSVTPKPAELLMKSAATKEIQEKSGAQNSIISEKLLQKLDKSIKHYNKFNKNGLKPGKLDKLQCIQSNSTDIETSIPLNFVPTTINNNRILIPRYTDCPNKNLKVKTLHNSQLLLNQSKVLTTSNAVGNNNSSLEPAIPNANMVGTPKVSSTTVANPSSITNSSVPANQSPSPNDCLKPQYIVHSLPKRLFHNNNKSTSLVVSAQNRNESTKMLKSKGDLSVGHTSIKSDHTIHNTASQMPGTFHNPQPQIQDPRSAYTYNSSILDNQRNNFPNSVNQCQPPGLSQCHLPNNKILRHPNPGPYFYTNQVWVPLPPPPPPMYVPPPYVYQIQQQSYSNSFFSASVPKQPPTSVSQDFTRALQPGNTNNSSIIGVNNDGLVKKINISGGLEPHVHSEEGSNNKNVISKMSSSGHREVVENKLQKLDKTSLPSEDIGNKIGDKPINGAKVEQSRKVALTSNNRGTSETLKLPVDKINTNMKIKQSQGYSPPILPIPTYHKVLNQVTPKSLAVSKDLQIRNCIPKTPVINDDFAKTNKRKDGAISSIVENRRKFKAKKISLEEYNKRIVKVRNSMPCAGIVSDDKINHNRKRPNVDKRDYNSTETDLGYDSDSTVIL